MSVSKDRELAELAERYADLKMTNDIIGRSLIAVLLRDEIDLPVTISEEDELVALSHALVIDVYDRGYSLNVIKKNIG